MEQPLLHLDVEQSLFVAVDNSPRLRDHSPQHLQSADIEEVVFHHLGLSREGLVQKDQYFFAGVLPLSVPVNSIVYRFHHQVIAVTI